MKMDGLQRLLDFLAMLNEKEIEFHISQKAPDSLTVNFALVGVRVEADFDTDMMHFSYFKGSEAVETDETILKKLIAENWE